MQCSVCGAEVDSGLLFCPSCGALVKSGGAKPAEPTPQPQPSQVEERAEYQPQPFAENQIGQQVQSPVEQPAAFQPSQGATPPPQPSPPPATGASPMSGGSEFEIVQTTGGNGKKVDIKGLSSISPKILIIAAVVLVAIIILLFVLIGGGSKPTPAPSPSSSASAATTNAASSEAAYLAVKDGKVAIFKNGSATPYRVTDIEVSDLDAGMAEELDSKPTFSTIDEAENRVDDYEAAIAKRTTVQSQTSSKISSKNENTITITVVGADGSTRTGTIHRSGSSERIFPDSNTRRLSKSEVSALSDAERCIAWNEIIAASNGYAFKNSGLASYFNSCSWYHRDPSASGSGNLTAEASANVELLKSKTDSWWINLATN